MEGDGETCETEGACAKPIQYFKRSKNKSRVWERVAWFTRRSRTRDEDISVPDIDSIMSHDIHMDLDTSPSSSTYGSASPLNMSLYHETSSSSDGETSDCQDSSQAKHLKLYPNSEIIEQNCLRPSIARALFHQIDKSNSKLHVGHAPKHAVPKKKARGQFHKSDSFRFKKDMETEELMLSRTVSMPSDMVEQSSCHCAACCTCTPAQRLMGMCPAHKRLSSSTASLDTGLSLSYSCNSPPADNSANSSRPSSFQEDDVTNNEVLCESPSRRFSPQFSLDLGQFKSNSLPMYYSKKCKQCGKPMYKSHLPYNHQDFQDIAVCLNACVCKSFNECHKLLPVKSDSCQPRCIPESSAKLQKDDFTPDEFKKNRLVL